MKYMMKPFLEMFVIAFAWITLIEITGWDKSEPGYWSSLILGVSIQVLRWNQDMRKEDKKCH